jgi:hypothetical protein
MRLLLIFLVFLLVLSIIILTLFISEFKPEKPLRNEEKACKILEEIYKVPFRKVRPDFLINPVTNKRLELDCYNDTLKIALEYQGVQHYKWPNFTGQNYSQYIQQKYRDEIKRRLCKDLGIKLIEVPYYIPHNQMKDYILKKLNE